MMKTMTTTCLTLTNWTLGRLNAIKYLAAMLQLKCITSSKASLQLIVKIVVKKEKVQQKSAIRKIPT